MNFMYILLIFIKALLYDQDFNVIIKTSYRFNCKKTLKTLLIQLCLKRIFYTGTF